MSDLIMVWDTETSGLIFDRKPKDDPAQPRLVSLAAKLYEADGTEVQGINLIVRPDGWTIPAEASRVHGITTERALAIGLPLRVVVAAFTNMRRVAAESVAHNHGFDKFVIECALAQLKVTPSSDWPEKIVCTCQTEEVGELTKVPATERQKKYYPNKKWKAPNLTELHTFLFGKGFDGAHSADADLAACAACFFELRKRGVL